MTPVTNKVGGFSPLAVSLSLLASRLLAPCLPCLRAVPTSPLRRPEMVRIVHSDSEVRRVPRPRCAPYCPPTASYRARSELAVASTGAIGRVPCVRSAGHGGVWCCVPGMQCMSGLCGGSCAPARPLRRAPPRAPPAAHVPRGCCPPRAPQPLAMVPGDVQVWPCPSVSAWALLACLVVYLCGKMSRVTMQRYHRVLPCSPMSH